MMESESNRVKAGYSSEHPTVSSSTDICPTLFFTNENIEDQSG